MSRVRGVFSGLWALILASTLAVQADAQVIPVRLASVGDGVVRNGVYVGYYTLAVPGDPSLDVWCVDFLNSVSVGNTWNAHVSSLAGSLANTRHGDAALDRYRRAAWLTQQFALNAHSEWGAIHAAIWVHMLPPSYPDNASPTPTQLRQYNFANWGGAMEEGWTSKVAYWMDRADQNYSGLSRNGFAIITDVNAVGRVTGGRQEYITTVTPEPATMILMGTGLVGILGVARVRRRRMDEFLAGAAGDQEAT